MTGPETIEVRVEQRVDEAPGIISLRLVRPDGLPLPPFTPGAHVDVFVGAWTRQYSLCNAPWELDHYLIGVLREPKSRGGSQAVHETLRAGDGVRISRPRNMFELVPAQKSILVGGGIGITPLLSMAAQLHAQRADFELHHVVRSLERAAFHGRIQRTGLARHTSWHVDRQDGTPSLPVDDLLAAPRAGTHLYLCGPEGFIGFVRARAQRHGWAAGNVHVEHFGAAGPVSGDEPFELSIASSGDILVVPADRSACDVLEEHGLLQAVSCRQGICGTCLTGVLEGVPDHRDSFMTDAEHAANNQFTPCVSRSKTRRLRLDL